MTAVAEVQALKEAHRKTWASGDYPRVAKLVTDIGERIVEQAGVKPGSRHAIVAHELVRVCRPGGTIALGNWAADGYIGRFWTITIMGPYLPPPPSYASPPADWGRVEHIEELLADYPAQLSFERRALNFEAESPAAFIYFLADAYGPLLGARNKLSGDGRWEPLRNKLIALSNEMNASDDGHFCAPSEYLITIAGRLNLHVIPIPFPHAKQGDLMPLRTNNPDVVVVGGGIAGASIAAVLARGGVEVLLLERQRGHRDRVRGEYMATWGVLEARALGLEDVIRCAHAADARYMVPYDELSDPSAAEEAKRDNSTFFPGVQGPLCASHPKTCQALAENAVRSGAELVCGVAGVRVQTGKRPSITIHNGTPREVRPRLVIGADGRASTVRRQSGIHINKAPATHVVAGLLVEGASRWPGDQYAIGVEKDLQFYVFPQGGGRLRLYTCHANEQANRWAGRAGAQHFVEAFAGLRSIPEPLGLNDVRPAGPCGTFSGEQTWCDEPYADGVVLIGDAGGYDDPVDGQGLSLAMCDVRRLSELLLASGDWTVATLRQYGEKRAERLRRMRRVSKTFAALMTTFTDAGRARRDRYYAASKAGHDHVRMALGAIFLGPERMPSEAFTDQLHQSLLA